jgi:hypothetical protein
MASVTRRVLSVATSVAVWSIAGAAVAQAHGGMPGPAELGPPVACSTVLGIVAYWAVILWPARKREEEEQDRSIKPKSMKRKRTRRKREPLADDKEYPVRLVVNR